MRRLRILGSGSILLAALLGSVGCAGWRSQIDPAAARYQQLASGPPPTAQKRLLLSLSVRHPGFNQSRVEERISSYRNAGVQFLRESGYFAEVGTGVAEPELELVLNITEEENYSDDLAFVSILFTAGAIPVYNRIETTASGAVYSGEGEKLGGLRVEENMSVLTSSLLLPAIPSFYTALSRTQRDVFRSAMVQMLEIEGIWR